MANSLERWPLRKVGELFEIQQWQSYLPLSRDGSNKLPFLRTTNVLWNRIVTDAVDTMSFTQDEVERLTLRPADLLVCEGGDIGRAAVWNDELPGCLYQNHVHRLRSTSANIDPWFMAYRSRSVQNLGLCTTAPEIDDHPLTYPHRAFSNSTYLSHRFMSSMQSPRSLSEDPERDRCPDQIVATLKELKGATMAKLLP